MAKRQKAVVLPQTLYVWPWDATDPDSGYSAVASVKEIAEEAMTVGVYVLETTQQLVVTRDLE